MGSLGVLVRMDDFYILTDNGPVKLEWNADKIRVKDEAISGIELRGAALNVMLNEKVSDPKDFLDVSKWKSFTVWGDKEIEREYIELTGLKLKRKYTTEDFIEISKPAKIKRDDIRDIKVTDVGTTIVVKNNAEIHIEK